MAIRYGIYDTLDHCWLGDTKGPSLLTEGDDVLGHPMGADQVLMIARIRAQMTNVQMGYPSTRLIAKLYDESGTKLKDEITTKMTAEEALRAIEEGEL